MKQVIFSFPTTLKELRESIKNKFKWFVHPKRRAHNNKVMSELHSKIVNELRSGYWDNDITKEMRERLCNSSPNGVIYKLVNNAFNKLI